mmetsp:Transcript_36328/g.104600  ORF Transcript_36328/g.104600 Transcript_36328/m.104600 type:complete len:214 (+) Transcript_36328:1431-2072(+)
MRQRDLPLQGAARRPLLPRPWAEEAQLPGCGHGHGHRAGRNLLEAAAFYEVVQPSEGGRPLDLRRLAQLAAPHQAPLLRGLLIGHVPPDAEGALHIRRHREGVEDGVERIALQDIARMPIVAPAPLREHGPSERQRQQHAQGQSNLVGRPDIDHRPRAHSEGGTDNQQHDDADKRKAPRSAQPRHERIGVEGAREEDHVEEREEVEEEEEQQP